MEEIKSLVQQVRGGSRGSFKAIQCTSYDLDVHGAIKNFDSYFFKGSIRTIGKKKSPEVEKNKKNASAVETQEEPREIEMTAEQALALSESEPSGSEPPSKAASLECIELERQDPEVCKGEVLETDASRPPRELSDLKSLPTADYLRDQNQDPKTSDPPTPSKAELQKMEEEEENSGVHSETEGRSRQSFQERFFSVSIECMCTCACTALQG